VALGSDEHDADGALPALLLVMAELVELGGDVLTWPSVSADALNQSGVGMGLAELGAVATAQEHGGLLVMQDDGEAARNPDTSIQLYLHYIDLTPIPLRKTDEFGGCASVLG
jgi:hypothetical protein